MFGFFGPSPLDNRNTIFMEFCTSFNSKEHLIYGYINRFLKRAKKKKKKEILIEFAILIKILEHADIIKINRCHDIQFQPHYIFITMGITVIYYGQQSHRDDGVNNQILQ